MTTEHKEIAGWGGVPGECGVQCACGVTFDGFDDLASAMGLLDRHIADATRAPGWPGRCRQAARRCWTYLRRQIRRASWTFSDRGRDADVDEAHGEALMDDLYRDWPGEPGDLRQEAS